MIKIRPSIKNYDTVLEITIVWNHSGTALSFLSIFHP